MKEVIRFILALYMLGFAVFLGIILMSMIIGIDIGITSTPNAKALTFLLTMLLGYGAYTHLKKSNL